MVPVRHVKTCESLKVVDARSSTSVVISQNVLLLRLDKILLLCSGTTQSSLVHSEHLLHHFLHWAYSNQPLHAHTLAP